MITRAPRSANAIASGRPTWPPPPMTTTSRSNSRLEAGAAILVSPSAASATHISLHLSARPPYRRFDTRSAGHAITSLGAHVLIPAEELFGLSTPGPARHQLTSGPT